MSYVKQCLAVAVVVLATQPAFAHPSEFHSPSKPIASSTTNETAAVRGVLGKYQAAVEHLDAAGTARLFTADSTIFESGGVEGNYANYLAHHLTPELAGFKSFRFSNYKVDVRFEGPIALATESYRYRIETKKGEIAERLGVATSALKKVGGQWKIISMHNSARKPKGS
ncbi:MAG: nuclear transport factor 2 family protein [Sphingomonas sp.]|nr:nuclear transport factor 2 family protein [Sphingomonas sp.]